MRFIAFTRMSVYPDSALAESGYIFLPKGNYSEPLIIKKTDSSCLHERSCFLDNQGGSV
jgi:hypothetical protein